MSESLAEFERRTAELDALRDANVRLQSQLTQAKHRNERLIEAASQAAIDATLSLGPVGPTSKPPKAMKTGDPEVALWVMTDWQLGKKTPSYGSEVAQERVLRFTDKAIKLTQSHRMIRPITEGVILFGGDMVEGVSFQFPSQPFEIDQTLFGQFVVAARLMVDVVQRALTTYDKVTVVSEYGNHGRIGSKRDVVPGSDNVDRMTYHLAREMLRGETRLMWEDSHEDIRRVEIGNYRALLIHGDEIGRGGFASPMTIVRHADRWRSGAYPWAFRDLYVGHWHTHAEWPMANGEGAVYQTGSTESENRYARDTMAASAIPSQRLHFVDPERGRVTAQYKLYVHE